MALDLLTPEQDERARRLLRDSLVISLHEHPVRFPLRMEETPDLYRTGRQHTAYAGLAASGNGVGLDHGALAALPQAARAERVAAAAADLQAAGADYVIDSVADLWPVLSDIAARIEAGERPRP